MRVLALEVCFISLSYIRAFFYAAINMPLVRLRHLFNNVAISDYRRSYAGRYAVIGVSQGFLRKVRVSVLSLVIGEDTGFYAAIVMERTPPNTYRPVRTK